MCHLGFESQGRLIKLLAGSPGLVAVSGSDSEYSSNGGDDRVPVSDFRESCDDKRENGEAWDVEVPFGEESVTHAFEIKDGNEHEDEAGEPEERLPPEIPE